MTHSGRVNIEGENLSIFLSSGTTAIDSDFFIGKNRFLIFEVMNLKAKALDNFHAISKKNRSLVILNIFFEGKQKTVGFPKLLFKVFDQVTPETKPLK